MCSMVYLRKDFGREYIFLKEKDGQYERILADDCLTVHSNVEEIKMVERSVNADIWDRRGDAKKNKKSALKEKADPKKRDSSKKKDDSKKIVTKEKSASKKKVSSKKDSKKKKKDTETSKSSTSNSSGLISSSVSNIVLIATIMCLLFVSCNAAPIPQSNALSVFAKNSFILARYVNGISIGQSISEGNFDKHKLIDELFYLGPDTTLDSLATSKVTELTSQLESIQKVIDEKCTEDNGCGVPSAMLSTMKTVLAYQKHAQAIKAAEEAFKGDEMGSLNQFSNILNEIEKQINEIKPSVFGHQISKLNANSTENGFKSVKEISEKLSKHFDLLKTAPSLIDKIEKSVWSDLKAKLSHVSPIKGIAKIWNDQTASTDLLKTWLASAEQRYSTIVSSINVAASQSIVEKLDVLLTLEPSATRDKKLTAGLFNGYDDFKSAITIDQNEWLKEFINSGEDLNATSAMLTLLEPISKQLATFSSVFEKAKPSGGHHLLNLKHQTESLGVLEQLEASIDTYEDCLFSFQTNHPFNVDVQAAIDWMNQKPTDLIKAFRDSIEKLIKDHEKPLKDLHDFANEIGPNSDKLQKVALIKQIVNNYENFQTDWSKVHADQSKTLSNWLGSGKVVEASSSTKKWVNDSKFNAVMDCFQTFVSYDQIEEFSSVAKSIALLKSGNDDINFVAEMVKSTGNLIEEWNKLKPSLSSKSKRKADAKKVDFNKISKDLGDISSITLKLDGMLKMKSDLNTLIGGKQAIESAIGGVKDQEEQDRLKKMWTPKNLVILQMNLDTSKAVSEVVSKNKVVGNMTDFKAPFEKASEVQGCLIDIRRLASSLKGMIQDQTVAASLESCKTLDLQFVKYDKARVRGVITDLQSYFDSVFGSKSSKFKQKKSKDDSSSFSGDANKEEGVISSWAIYAIVAVCVVLVTAGVAGLLIWYCCFYLKNKKQEKKKTPEEIEEEIRKENARREAELKRLHEIKMTEQQLVEKVGKQDFYFPYFNPLFARPNVPPADGVNKVATSNTKTVEEKKAEIMKDITHEDIAVKEEVPKKILEDNKPHILGLLKQRKYSQAGINAFFEKLEEYFVNFMTKTKISWKRLATVPEALTQEMFFAPMIDVPQPKPESLAEKEAIGPLLAEKNTLIIIGSNDQIIRNRNKPKDASTKTGQSTKTSQSTKTVPPPSTKTSRPTDEIGTARDLTEETDAKSARTAVSISERRGSSGSDLSTESVKLNLYQNSNDDISVDKTESEASLLTPRSSLHDLEAGTIPDSSSHYGAFNCGAPCGHSHTFDNDRRRYREWTPEQIDKRKRDVMGPPITSPNDVYFVKERELERLGERIQELERAESAKQEILVLEQQAEKLSEQDERNPLLQVMPI